MENRLNKGDTIKCSDKDELVKLSVALAKENIDTDFLYEQDGEKGLWLIVTKVKCCKAK